MMSRTTASKPPRVARSSPVRPSCTTSDSKPSAARPRASVVTRRTSSSTRSTRCRPVSRNAGTAPSARSQRSPASVDHALAMTSRTTRRRLAWSVPAVTAAAVIAGSLLPSTASADAHPKLPPRTPARLLAAVQDSTVEHLSGTIVETARLGLPSLPGADDTAALTWQTLVTGTHTARVWSDGKDHQRLALLGQLSESDIVHS